MKPAAFAFALTFACASAAIAAPDYQETMLQSIFPAGAARGQTVEVRFQGVNGSLQNATDIVIDGPPGIRVLDVKPAGADLQATLAIAADAQPGRRMLRVRGGKTGLTNFRWFFVGPTAEVIETERNNTPATAETVEIPLVVNGRVQAALDQDCFRFQVRAGQRLTAAVLSHGMDVMGFGRDNAGFADTSLELLDEEGRVLASSGDALGFDPVLECEAPRDGWYTARVSGMGYKGFPEMVYRLAIGEMPYPVAVFPPGGPRGESVEVEFFGLTGPLGLTAVIPPAEDETAVQYISPPGPFAGLHELPFVRSEGTEIAIREAASEREEAIGVELPVTINGRFQKSDRRDWLRLRLEKDEGVRLEVAAQRHLRAPVDTLLEIVDQKGEVVARNDDGEIFAAEVSHDFVPFDSFLEFRAKEPGDYWVSISEESGAAGPRAMYRLTAEPLRPDFRAYQWPDAVPVWGPGSTAAFVVETHRLGDFRGDIELSIEGLPAGWTGCTAVARHRDYKPPRSAFGHKTFLTITAPADAAVGTTAEFHVVARADIDGQTVEHRAQPLTLYLWQEPNRFRHSPVSRAAVAPPQEIRLDAPVRELSGSPGATIEFPVTIHGDEALLGQARSFSVNRAGTHFKCSLGPQVKIDALEREVRIPWQIPTTLPPGEHEILISDGWAGETRKGLPGPSTPIIRLRVEQPASGK